MVVLHYIKISKELERITTNNMGEDTLIMLCVDQDKDD